MDLPDGDDVEIEKLLELRNKLMNQLQEADSGSASKHSCPFKYGKQRLPGTASTSAVSRKQPPSWKRPKDSGNTSPEQLGVTPETKQRKVSVSSSDNGRKERGVVRKESCDTLEGPAPESNGSDYRCNSSEPSCPKSTNQPRCPWQASQTRGLSSADEQGFLKRPADDLIARENGASKRKRSTGQEESHFRAPKETTEKRSSTTQSLWSPTSWQGTSVDTVNAPEVSATAIDVRHDTSASSPTEKSQHAENLNLNDGILPPPPPPPLITDMNAASENGRPVVGEGQEKCTVEKDSEICMPSTSNGFSGAESKDGTDEFDDDVLLSEDEETIDTLLERPYEGNQTGKVPLPEEGEKREKVVLAHRDTDYFDVLPEGWVEVTHNSGLPIYLHKTTRVCTFSRPYFIGPGSVRHHSVPESAIPCLHQQRVLRDVEERAKESEAALEEALKSSANGEDGVDRDELAKLTLARLQAPGTKVQSADDFKQRQLDPQALHEYAKKVFRFKTIQIYRFNKWSATRNFHRQKKMAEAERLGKLAPSIEVPAGRPTLPSSVQLITVPALETNQKPHHKGFFLNPHGKTSVSILHEYVQKVLKSTISYEFEETRNSSTPYGCSARLKINLNNRVMNAATIKEKLLLLQEKQKRDQELQHGGTDSEEDYVVLGRGCGNSKKAAKLDAARSALKVLIPAIEFDNEGIARTQKKEGEETNCEEGDAVALFDMLPIEDSRIPDLSARAGQPSPYLILQECLKRHAVHGDTEIKLRSERVKHQKHKFDMDVGKHTVSVVCSNKREGKQMASQAMLKKLHPQFDNWGSLIRLYGQETQQKHQEARRCRQSIIKLQGSRDKEGSSLEPNKAILEKLRAEMLNVLRTQQERRGTTARRRPGLSYSGEPMDPEKANDLSEDYANTHPDTQSTIKIDF